MQDAVTASPWIQYLVGVLFGAGGFAAVYKLFLERKKPKAEIHESQSRARLNDSDANAKDVDASIKASDMILKSAQRLAEHERTIAKLEVERDHWRDQYKMIEKTLYDFQHGGSKGNGK